MLSVKSLNRSMGEGEATYFSKTDQLWDMGAIACTAHSALLWLEVAYLRLNSVIHTMGHFWAKEIQYRIWSSVYLGLTCFVFPQWQLIFFQRSHHLDVRHSLNDHNFVPRKLLS